MPSISPPFSPVLLLGLALRPVPPDVVARLAAPAVAAANRRLAPLLADRLQGLSGTVAVVPTDFAYGVRFDVADGRVVLSFLPEEGAAATDARLRAPVRVLLELARASGLDGDASFFSRELIMEGDTGLVMALRYALEEAAAGGLDPMDLLAEAVPGPAPLRRRVTELLDHALSQGEADAALVRDAILAPLAAWKARTDRRLTGAEERLDDLDRRLTRLSARKEAAHVRP